MARSRESSLRPLAARSSNLKVSGRGERERDIIHKAGHSSGKERAYQSESEKRLGVFSASDGHPFLRPPNRRAECSHTTAAYERQRKRSVSSPGPVVRRSKHGSLPPIQTHQFSTSDYDARRQTLHDYDDIASPASRPAHNFARRPSTSAALFPDSFRDRVSFASQEQIIAPDPSHSRRLDRVLSLSNLSTYTDEGDDQLPIASTSERATRERRADTGRRSKTENATASISRKQEAAKRKNQPSSSQDTGLTNSQEYADVGLRDLALLEGRQPAVYATPVKEKDLEQEAAPIIGRLEAVFSDSWQDCVDTNTVHHKRAMVTLGDLVENVSLHAATDLCHGVGKVFLKNQEEGKHISTEIAAAQVQIEEIITKQKRLLLSLHANYERSAGRDDRLVEELNAIHESAAAEIAAIDEHFTKEAEGIDKLVKALKDDKNLQNDFNAYLLQQMKAGQPKKSKSKAGR